MSKSRKIISVLIAAIFIQILVFNSLPLKISAKSSVPQVAFVSAPVTEYTVGDRVRFDIYSQNYGGRVEYRVVLWEDSKKTYHDLWNSGNGYPNRYYTKWQPYGNNTFTLGWPIFEPGSYRITVYVKRLGISNSKAALKGMNCDSYKESVAFVVKPKKEQTQEQNAGDQNTDPNEGQGTTEGTPDTGNTGNAGETGNTTDPGIPGGGTVEESLKIEAAGVVLSNGVKLKASRIGNTNEFYVDLSGYDSALGVRTSFTVNKDCKIEIMGNEFQFKAHTSKTFGPKDFGMPDNDPPGIGLWNLRDNFADAEGYYSDSVIMNEETGESLIVTIKMKVK